MASTAGSSVGFRPGSGRRHHTWRQALSRVAGVASVAICVLLVFVAFGATVLDLGAVGLPALALAVTALALAVTLKGRGRAGAAFAIAAISVPLVVGAMLGGAAVGEGIACGDRERQALAQIPHLGGAQPGIAGDLATGGCIVRYTADTDESALVRHYTEALGGAGWRLGNLHEIGSAPMGDLYASRGGLHAWVSWIHTAGSSMRIIVSVND